MKSYLSKLSVILLLFGFYHTCSAQEKVYMPFFEPINVDESYQYSTSRLFKNYVDAELKYRLILPLKNDTAFIYSFEHIQKEAAKAGAALFAIGELNRISEALIVNISLYKTADGSTVWTDRLKADTPEDLNPLLQKMAKNFSNLTKAGPDDIFSISGNTTAESKKARGKYKVGVGLGGLTLVNQPITDVFAGVEFISMFQNRNLIIQNTFKYYVHEKAHTTMLSVEGYYPFIKKRFTPFLGGGLAFSWFADETNIPETYVPDYESTYTGLIALAGGGYVFNSTSSIVLRASANLFKGFYTANTIRPQGILFKLEVLFGKR